jgi:glycerol-3-phosphate dehydrogenase subunit C
MAKSISYSPTDGLTYDPEDPKYWEDDALDKEVERVFEICNGCRMCFKFCDSFPTLFSLVDDAAHDGDVRKLTQPEKQQVMDACFQCKLCEVQCPYTPRDKHEYQLDFPKLVHRFHAQHSRFTGVKLRDELLGNPDLLAAAGRASFGLANAMNKVTPHRVLMEKALGIHRQKLLPDFAQQTFERWAEKQGHMDVQPGEAEVVLFQTCFVQNNAPEVGRDTLDVLTKNGVKTACVSGFKCCGMPAWEHGDLERVRAWAKTNLSLLMPYVDAGAKVLVINPTCSMMMRREWPELLAREDRDRAGRLAAAVRDPGEFLWSIRKEPRFSRDFKSTPGETVSYHAPCHLRAQHVGFKGRELIGYIPGVQQVKNVLECCGHDGTYAMKVEGFEPSARIGKKAFDEMKDNGAELWVTECPLAAIQFQQHAGKKPMHPMTVLARAYREDGFPTKVQPT